MTRYSDLTKVDSDAASLYTDFMKLNHDPLDSEARDETLEENDDKDAAEEQSQEDQESSEIAQTARRDR